MKDALLPDRTKFGRIFYGLTILFLVFRWKGHLLLSQLEQPQLVFVGMDYTYLVFALSGLTRFFGQHQLASLIVDMGLIFSAVLAFIYPNQNKFSIVFTTLLTIYIIVGYSFLCFHKHNLIGLWFCSLLFLPGDSNGFAIMFRLVRYYCLFAYASSGFWKFYRNVWNAKGHLSVILKNDALQFMVQHPFSVRTNMISWLVIHPAFLDNLMLITCFFQLAFVIGFFTRRLDWFFLIFVLTFHLLALIFLRAYFLEFSLILITLLPLRILYDNKKVLDP